MGAAGRDRSLRPSGPRAAGMDRQCVLRAVHGLVRIPRSEPGPAFAVKREGVHIDERMHREWLRPRVVRAVLQRRARRETEGLFDRVGEELNIGGGTARDIYYESATREWREFIEAQMKILVPGKS